MIDNSVARPFDIEMMTPAEEAADDARRGFMASHNIVTTRIPGGWQAYDEDTYDGAPDAGWPFNCIGYGGTEQEAIDDLCSALELPYSYRRIAL